MQNNSFFQAFFGPQNNKQQIQAAPEYILYNEAVLEIYNNWEHVTELIYNIKNKKIETIDQLEQSWYNFITSNHINVEIYKNKEEFLSAFWKNS